ncbi:hypothetical protein L484_000671 [Morus notabilis]|uniref:Uncharacterized protein n=1 Tax=Morus notabilis TaxID=981085 RepID=W9R0A4_9ROSA|nr:hypothetical protein L484_000671 [Morus notabilis]
MIVKEQRQFRCMHCQYNHKTKRALYRFGSAPHRQNPDTTDSREPQIWTQPCCRTTTPPSSSWRLPVRLLLGIVS